MRARARMRIYIYIYVYPPLYKAHLREAQRQVEAAAERALATRDALAYRVVMVGNRG